MASTEAGIGLKVDRRTAVVGGAAAIVAGCSGWRPGISPTGSPALAPASTDEWLAYGAGNAATKYSPLDQIDAGNAQRLEIAWEWRSPDADILAAHPDLKPGEFQATPILADGVLYTSTAMSQVAAIDPATGAQLWVHDPGTWKRGPSTVKGFQHRGVAYWRDGEDARVLIGTGDNRLIALDTRTGQPIAGFGNGGEVDLNVVGMQRPVPREPEGLCGVTSPPLICRDTVIVGQYINDRTVTDPMPPGDVRGFDVRTGALKWVFHTVPMPGEFGYDSWTGGSAARSGNANIWAPMSADDALGLVYLPGSCPTDNFYGGDRPGDNLFGNCLIALDAGTGKRRWHYQLVHHDVWDYDLPCAPNLVDITVDGRRIPAVAQVTKHGFCFVFDRRDGTPVWPIEERPVPQSELAGERTAPTQPFPTRPPAFERQGIADEDLIDFTPALKDEARKIIANYKAGPLFTPPGTRSTTVLPSWVGGANWWGAAVDPETAMLYVPSIAVPVAMALNDNGERTDAADSPLEIAGRAALVRGPKGLPILKPPYGRITAIDLNKGAIAWWKPNAPGLAESPAFKPFETGWTGTLSRTGPLLTRTLLFLGEGPHVPGMSRKLLRAWDKATGEVRAEIALPDYTHGPPMTYMAGGRQFIVCGMGYGGSPHRLVALALPEGAA